MVLKWNFSKSDLGDFRFIRYTFITVFNILLSMLLNFCNLPLEKRHQVYFFFGWEVTPIFTFELDMIWRLIFFRAINSKSENFTVEVTFFNLGKVREIICYIILGWCAIKLMPEPDWIDLVIFRIKAAMWT